MTMVVFDADEPGDEALDNSHWVAERTAALLGPATLVVRGVDATRESVEEALNNTQATGFVYCGHGQNNALRRGDICLVDLENLHMIGDRWFHAFACNSGNSLAVTACRERVNAYLGYHDTVIVEWTVHHLPATLECILERIVTTASILLRDGERSRGRLLAAVELAYEEWIAWDQEYTGSEELELSEFLGLHALRRLFACAEFHGTAVID